MKKLFHRARPKSSVVQKFLMPWREMPVGRLIGPREAKSTGDFTAFMATMAKGSSIATASAPRAIRRTYADGPRRILRRPPRRGARAETGAGAGAAGIVDMVRPHRPGSCSAPG